MPLNDSLQHISTEGRSTISAFVDHRHNMPPLNVVGADFRIADGASHSLNSAQIWCDPRGSSISNEILVADVDPWPSCSAYGQR